MAGSAQYNAVQVSILSRVSSLEDAKTLRGADMAAPG